MEGEDTNQILRMKKIKLELTSQQKKIFHKWNDHARYSYNKTVWLMNEVREYDKLYLRNLVVPKEVNADKEWLLETPKDVRAGSVFEAAKNIKACFTNLKRDNISKFKMNFRSRKDKKWSITIPSKALSLCKKTSTKNKYIKVFPKANTCPVIKCTEFVSENMLSRDCLLHFDGMHYYLCVPCEKTPKKCKTNDTISLDPGVRTFLTGYSPNGTICKLGDNASNRLYRLLLRVDSLISQITKVNQRRRRQLIKKKNKILSKVKNLTNELHHKTALFLVSNYKNIIIPDFESKSMSNRNKRKIKSKTVRNMLSLSHGKFKTILKAKAIEYESNVILTDEAYTTKTCSCCGKMNYKIGGKKKWTCQHCQTTHDRDGNAARNIFIASLSSVEINKEMLIELASLLDRTTVDSAVLTASKL
jgi:putative transposase